MKRFLLLPFILLISFVSAQEYWMEDGSVTTCSGTFHDSGGPATGAGYQANENYVYTICPDRTGNAQNAIGVEFTLRSIQTGRDLLNVYDGDDTTAPLIMTVGGGADPLTILASEAGINPSGCLTFEFISDEAGQGQGWNADIFCHVPCQTITPTVTTVPARDVDGNVTILEGESVSFTGSATFSQSGTGATYLWDFGDGTTSTELNPTHTYTDAGTYNVSFTVTDGSGNPDCSVTYTFLVMVTYDNNVPCPAVEGIDLVENSSDVTVNCNYPLTDGCMRLTADYVPMHETSQYTVQSIPFQPPYPVTEGAGIPITLDDRWSPVIPFPAATDNTPAYNFCFFGEEEDALVVGANGRISFDLSHANQFDTYAYTDALPTMNADMTNSIFGAYHDMNIAGAGTVAGTRFSYGFQGTYPCRMFVVNYNELPQFSCTNQRTTQQIVLWEGSNYIDVYIHNKPDCDFTNDLIGIMGNNMNQFSVPPGRNTGDWAAQNEAWRFIPSGPEMDVQVEWFDADGLRVGTSQNLDVCPREDTFYDVEVTYEICGQEPITVTDRINITFNYDSPEIEDLALQVCDTEGDGSTSWDLEEITANVLDDNPDWSIQGYYEDFRSADEGNTADAITNTTDFESGTTTVFVRVDDASNGCHGVFEIQLDFLEDLELEILTTTECIPPTEEEFTFNLFEFNEHYLENEFYDIFYYENEADAQAGNDEYLTTEEALEYAVSEPITIYVRVETEDGCFGLSELIIEINDGPDDYVFEQTVQFCDNPELGSEIVDLTAFEDDIAGAQTGLSFMYYEDYDDAVNVTPGTEIADPTQYNLTTDVTTIWVVAMDENGCYKPIEMPISLLEGLELLPATIPLCDIGNDNTQNFDLSSVSEDIIANSASFTFTYYTSEDDANNGMNPITSDITEYASAGETIWVIVSTGDNCSSLTTITLELDPTPEINFAELFVCADADGNYVFDLTEAEATLLGGQTGLTLSYFNNELNASENNTAAAIADPTNYTGTEGEIVYVRLESEDCFSVSQITLHENETPEVSQAPAIQVCDLDANGSETVDLTQNEAVITNGVTGLTVSYYLSQEDAAEPVNAIANPAAYQAAEGTTVIWVRVENEENCFAITSFEVIIDDGLTLAPGNLELCDLDNDDTETWDLTDDNETIIANSENYTFIYYPSQSDLENETNPITNPEAYDAGNTTIYVHVTNDQGCFADTTLTLTLTDGPAINHATLAVCVDADGNFIYDLTEAETELLGGQTGITLTYFNSFEGADDNNTADAITNPDAYTGTDGEIVFVRLEDGNNCHSVSQITLGALPQPVATQPDNLFACDADNSGSENMDLTQFEAQIIGTQTGLTVSYHTSQANADNNVSPINNATAYPVNAGTITIYVRVDNGECYATTTFEVTVMDGLPLTDASITLCDVGEDGSELFDITSMNDVISNNVSTYTYAYFASLADLEAGNPITGDLTQYASGGETIFVQATAADCSNYAELDLILKDLPTVNDNEEYVVCDPEFDGTYSFTLTDLNGIVVNNTSGFSFEYYTSLSDAENQQNPFTQANANMVTNVPMQIFVRVTETGQNPSCTNFAVVNLVQGEATQVNTIPDPLKGCDDGFGTGTFNLSDMADAVTNETGNLWISYHYTLANAQNDSNPIDPDNAQLSTGTIYVRVTAEGKCPGITQFDVDIVPNPVAEIVTTETSYCMTESLQISAGSFDPEMTYTWTNQDGSLIGTGETIELLGQDGDQTVTLTVTSPTSNCFSDTTVDFDAVDIPTITSLNTTNNSIQVAASGQGPFEYSIDGINWQTSSVFENLLPGMYTVLIRSLTAGCEGVGMATLVLDVANIITPNGDGLNDFFRVPFMDAFRDEAGNVQASYFYIYDRYGKLLHEDVSSNEKTEFIWHGTGNGRPLPSGDYWYLLRLADGRTATGHITVKHR